MAKILQFPKGKSTRAEIIKRSLQQKAVIPLSLLSVLVVTLSLNEWIVTAAQRLNTARGVASVPVEDLEKQIKWERRWAESLQKSNVRPGQAAQAPNQLDELLFGVLQGDVKMTREGSLISSLEMKRPVELKNREEFLESYKGVWAIAFEQARLDKSDDQQEVYNLVDQKGRQVGRAIFGLDSLQTVTKLQFLTQ
ncbi:MAG: hypothetical protein ACK5Y2_02640 [Bdellovibrionales bacterium]